MKLMGLVLACMLALTACGGGNGGGAKYDTAAALAKAAGYTGCTKDSNVLSDDAVDCAEGRANLFKSGDSEAQWWNAAKVVGSIGGSYLRGDGWAIECETPSTCADAKVRIGGKIVTY